MQTTSTIQAGGAGRAGHAAQLCEYLQNHFPGLARLLHFPAKLSPVSAEVAPELSARQLKIWSPG